ncbi:DNA mismatch repair protein MutS2 [Desulfurobacterium pacificum]|uniref:Endonuclease MutS2 n=1 Tax=Desulfurobacterium pacificum TaxID=240166 RepID=A0ABY1NTQ3_9BACT|nr:endonuclease MutS2 [Desulfurobacterium pacificum]SMP17933.1 DNA mismatch repair protein MutS2 [Desulfurobacterium pacificum]
MFKGVERQLEFDKILQIASEFAKSVPGKDSVLSIRPIVEKEKVQKELELTSSFCRLLSERPVPLETFPDISSILKKLTAEGVVLGESAFVEILKVIRVASVLRRFFEELDSRFERLKTYSDRIYGFSELKEVLESTFDDYGNVLDTASPSLAAVRREVLELSYRIKRKLEDLVNRYDDVCPDRIVTERDGRYVVLVKPHFRKKFKAIVHDRSSSGQTYYVEPLSVVEDNNKLQELRSREREEIERILKKLSLLVFQHRSQLQSSFKALVEIDRRLAVAQFSLKVKGVMPEFSEEVKLKQAKHPLLLLSDREVVPVDIFLKNGLVITGSNTGGKTVTLKTLGLLSMMAQSGFLIPAEEGSSLRFFKKWMVDIGDEQSIEQSLSTFSAHISNVAKILKEADSDTLVLLDELGAGTDPVEGSSLAVAILEFLKRKRVKTVVTTHFTPVKLYAYKDDYYEVASVLFDEITLKPLYKLVYGLVGKSYALEIASRYGVPQEVIDMAKRILGNEGKIAEDIISALEEEYKKLVKEREELKRKEKELEERERRVLKELSEELRAFIEELEEKSKKALQSAKSGEIKQIVVTAKKKLDSLQVKESKSVDDFSPGMTVKVKSTGRKGKVVEVNRGRGVVKVQLGSIKVEMKPDQLEVVEEVGRKEDVSVVNVERPKRFFPELKLLGMRGEEALRALEEFLDDAAVLGFKSVKVVHGHGAGILKRLVREYLKESPYVKSFRPGKIEEGGDGVTIVELK